MYSDTTEHIYEISQVMVPCSFDILSSSQQHFLGLFQIINSQYNTELTLQAKKLLIFLLINNNKSVVILEQQHLPTVSHHSDLLQEDGWL